MAEKIITDSCAFLPCDQVSECAMVGGCVRKRFPSHYKAPSAVSHEAMADNARALNGILPGRTNRDPSKIKRERKPLNAGNPLKRRR